MYFRMQGVAGTDRIEIRCYSEEIPPQVIHGQLSVRQAKELVDALLFTIAETMEKR